MPKVDLTIEVPALPEGWQGTPDELLQFFAANALYSIDGDFPVGQIGGPRPTEDAGIWYGDNSIEKFLDGKYRTITDVPIGSILPWASTSSTPPENYLICDGASLIRLDYSELFAVIGTVYGSESATTFNLPDMRGRGTIGSGIGDYAKQGITGRMAERTAGSYIGFEWVTRENLLTNQPKKSMKDTPDNKGLAAAKNKYLAVQTPAIAMPQIIRYR
jgi:microcystin-dependent protein